MPIFQCKYVTLPATLLLRDDAAKCIVHLMIHGSMNEQHVIIFRSYLTRKTFNTVESQDLT